MGKDRISNSYNNHIFYSVQIKRINNMRVCIEKITGKLVEAQGGGRVDRLSQEEFQHEDDFSKYLASCNDLEATRLNTLKQNALNAGYTEDEIEVKWVTDEEWARIQVELNKPTPEQKAEKEAAKVRASLLRIDLESIRSIREWIVKQPGAPAYLKDYET
jgi:hypothetical protein